MAKRIEWIDDARGIAILAVIVGHTLGPYTTSLVGSLIYAVHMPIFFVLSGYLYHSRPVNQEFRHSACNLLVPYATTAVLVLALNGLALRLPANPLLHAPFVSTKQGLVAVLYGGGSTVFNPWGWQIQPIGAIWFLLSMFIAIQIFNALMRWTAMLKWRRWIRVGVVISLTLIGGLLGRIVYLPWALNAAFFSLIFFYAGYCVRQFNLLVRISDWWYGIFGLAWLISGWQGGFWLNVPASPNLVISIVGGIGGSLCLIRFCMELAKRRLPGTPRILRWYGQLSLIVLCVHLLNLTTLNVDVHVFNWLQPLTGTIIALLVQITCRIGFVTVGLLVVPKIPVLRAGLFPRRYLGR